MSFARKQIKGIGFKKKAEEEVRGQSVIDTCVKDVQDFEEKLSILNKKIIPIAK